MIILLNRDNFTSVYTSRERERERERERGRERGEERKRDLHDSISAYFIVFNYIQMV